MTMVWQVVLITAIAGVGGTGLGGLIGALFKKDSSRIVSLLLSFAGGVMMAVVCFDLISSAILPENADAPISVFIVMAGILFGYCVVYLLNYIIFTPYYCDGEEDVRDIAATISGKVF